MKAVCLLVALVAVSALTNTEFNAVKTAFQTHFPNNQEDLGHFPRIAFLDCVDECNGCIGSSTPGVTALTPAMDRLEVLHAAIGGNAVLSRGDFWVFAANMAFVTAATNPRQRPTNAVLNLVDNIAYGRPVVTCANLAVCAGAPLAKAYLSCATDTPAFSLSVGWAGNRRFFQDMNLGARDNVAIMGFHTLGSLENDRTDSGYTGKWVPNNFVFDNQYYSWLLGPYDKAREWTMKDTAVVLGEAVGPGSNSARLGPRYQWFSHGDETMMLNADMSLMYDFETDFDGLAYCKGKSMLNKVFEEHCAFTEKTTNLGLVADYRNDWVYWMDDFASAWTRYTEWNQGANLNRYGNGGGIFGGLGFLG